MIGHSEEFEKMARLEGQLWWYRSLHKRVETALRRQFGDRKTIKILDAGCGTGGMLAYLRKKGYTDLWGIDGSADAIAFCQQHNLPVTSLNLNDLAHFEPHIQYDAIICNDVFCYFTDADLLPLIQALQQRLKPAGILMSNNNAFNAFEGQHDIAVGVIRRFVLSDFARMMPEMGMRIIDSTYWSFTLSIPILLMRQWQRLQLVMGWRTVEEAQSDVYLPAPWLNETLYWITEMEQKLFQRTPFGSSLFITVVTDPMAR
ncbi:MULTISPECIES: class I SAM-dependent methyltransferase [unclassified Spirosoma]|uniref:class I SAM-dependent DNA methyltransferase n=1 Tax=unclassified Spirosoma TaxID=2621999 RepID=UPI000959F4DF|nr:MULTISPECIES: class I SAM-dependent methyltransferase [unclassified Spirosoma]MBN8821739.1 class I SAM-dependent methyltransferase [Spirosoma sp.]OJW80767.1 MAG: chemotaxis protein CheR [Spirosoma sp. 48-14]